MYQVRLVYGPNDTQTHNYPSWLAAQRAFNEWKANKPHAPEIQRVELVVRGDVEERA